MGDVHAGGADRHAEAAALAGGLLLRAVRARGL